MDLLLIPDNPEHTTLVSTNGVAHYQVNTTKSRHGGLRRTLIQRPAETHEASVVAEIDWGALDRPTVLRSSLLPVHRPGCSKIKAATTLAVRATGVFATDFLYKKSQFSSSRYFLGDDLKEYRWKAVKGVGFLLCNAQTNQEVARYTIALGSEGLYAGERKSRLRIQPGCSLDVELVVLSFLIMEKKRREKAGESSAMMVYHDEEPQGDGCADGDGGVGS